MESSRVTGWSQALKIETLSVRAAGQELVPTKGMRMPRAQMARSSWDRRRPRSAATWHPIGELPPPPPCPSPAPGGGSVQRGQCADWNTAGAPPSRYTARHVADSAAQRGGGARSARRRRGWTRPRRPGTGKGIGESPAARVGGGDGNGD